MLFGAFSNFAACTLFINANLKYISFVKLMFMIQINVNIFYLDSSASRGCGLVSGASRTRHLIKLSKGIQYDLQMWLTFYKKKLTVLKHFLR